MSAGTSGILPSATYAANDNVVDASGNLINSEPLWLSTRGGAIDGNVNITGSLTVSNMVTAAMLSGLWGAPAVGAGPFGTLGINNIYSIVLGNTRICWGYTTTFNQDSHTVSLIFGGLPAGTLALQSGTGVYNKVGSTGAQFAVATAVQGLSTGGIVGVFLNQAPVGTNTLGAVTFQEENANAVGATFLAIGQWEGAP